MPNEEMTKTDDTAMAEYTEGGVPLGFESFDDDEDLKQIPLLRICQQMTKNRKTKDNPEGIEEGHLYNTLTGQSWESLEVIFCYNWQSRVLFGEPGKPNVCWSRDAKVPDARNPVSKNCMTCEENKKPNGEWGNCKKGINLVTLCPDGKEKFGIMAYTFMSADSVIGKKILNGMRHEEVPLWNYVFKLTPKMKNTGQGDFYSILFDRLRPATKEEKERAHEQWLAMRRNTVEIRDEETDGDAAKEDASPDVPF